MLNRVINDPKVLNVYMYGSRVYGCSRDDSDYDYVVVIDDSCNYYSEQINTDKYNFTFYKVSKFEQLVKEHEIAILECLFLGEKNVVKNNNTYNFELDIAILRQSVSQKSSNSFVKCKKKLTVDKDYNPYIGKKSLFHAIRIILFGIQIARFGRIVDYSEANNYYQDIVLNEINDWNYYKEKYQLLYNCLKTQFRLVAPKGLI